MATGGTEKSGDNLNTNPNDLTEEPSLEDEKKTQDNQAAEARAQAELDTASEIANDEPKVTVTEVQDKQEYVESTLDEAKESSNLGLIDLIVKILEMLSVAETRIKESEIKETPETTPNPNPDNTDQPQETTTVQNFDQNQEYSNYQFDINSPISFNDVRAAEAQSLSNITPTSITDLYNNRPGFAKLLYYSCNAVGVDMSLMCTIAQKESHFEHADIGDTNMSTPSRGAFQFREKTFKGKKEKEPWEQQMRNVYKPYYANLYPNNPQRAEQELSNYLANLGPGEDLWADMLAACIKVRNDAVDWLKETEGHNKQEAKKIVAEGTMSEKILLLTRGEYLGGKKHARNYESDDFISIYNKYKSGDDSMSI